MTESPFRTADRTLIRAFLDTARLHPDAELVVCSAQRPGTHRLAEILTDGLRFAAGLRACGVVAGDIVAVQLPAWSEWTVACIGIAHVGAVILPVVSIYGAQELGFILRQSGAKILVTPDRWRGADYGEMLAACGALPALGTHVVVGDAAPVGAVRWEAMLATQDDAPPAERQPDDLAMLIYTSGTTAVPKGVCHSSRTLLSELVAFARARQNSVEITLSPWPPGHVAGACTMLRYLVNGTKLVLMDQWDASQAATLIDAHRVSACGFTPFHLTGLLDAADRNGHDLSTLVSCLVGAAPVPPMLIERCAARGLKTFRCYGSTEHPTVTTGAPSDSLAKRLATEGRLMIGSEMRFVDDDGDDVTPGMDGEMVTRGPELFTGYFDSELNAAAVLPGGWYRSGDIGHFDADGFLVITDRKKDIIIRGGENISSREVEHMMLGDPAVLDVAVVAYPDTRMGEIVCAYVVAAPGKDVTLESVRAYFARAGVARQKTPERIVLVSELPRNSTGKVLKNQLRARTRAEATEEFA